MKRKNKEVIRALRFSWVTDGIHAARGISTRSAKKFNEFCWFSRILNLIKLTCSKGCSVPDSSLWQIIKLDRRILNKLLTFKGVDSSVWGKRSKQIFFRSCLNLHTIPHDLHHITPVKNYFLLRGVQIPRTPLHRCPWLLFLSGTFCACVTDLKQMNSVVSIVESDRSIASQLIRCRKRYLMYFLANSEVQTLNRNRMQGTAHHWRLAFPVSMQRHLHDQSRPNCEES